MDLNKKILIVDDHPVFRAGMMSVLRDRGFNLLSEASDGNPAIKMLSENKPDIVILDMNMPGLSGIEVLEKLNSVSPQTKAIFLTMYKDSKIFNKVMDLGVKGYILKESAVMEIFDCIETISREEYYISPLLSSFLVERLKKKEKLEAETTGLLSLTETEKNVLSYIAQSLTSNQIAEKLFVSRRTVDKHRENICRKLDVHGSLNLIKFAIENKHSLT